MGPGMDEQGDYGIGRAHQKNGLPSGKLNITYGKPPFSIGKSSINGHFQ
jgi:hypothetical protein